MGYCIAYDEKTGAMEVRRRRRINKKLVLGFIAIALAVTVVAIPKSRRALKTALLPGDGAVTEQALQGLVEDLRQGSSVSQAVEAFCREIIANE